MVQFNLLPDVKIVYVKAERTKRLVMTTAVVTTAISFTLFLLLFIVVQGVQKKSLSDLDRDITKYSKQLQNTKDLNKILTIQSQLDSINGLHDQKVAASRISNIMQQVTPADVTISAHKVDFAAFTMEITGQASSLDRVNTFIDTLKFARFDLPDQEDQKAFSQVVLAEFERDEKGSTYTIKTSYDAALFNNSETPSLVIPKTVTTRSVIGQPTDLFKRLPEPAGTVEARGNR